MKQKRVVVGMSGGVDSSVTALLLKEQGYAVTGLFMRNWSGDCSAAEDYEDVQRVCEALDLPYYAVDFCEEYQERVFKQFLDELKAGETPNPDILCNREIKFNVFLKQALELGADFLATGHYCRRIERGGKVYLGRGKDSNKDQSYFLHAVDSKALEKTLFPIGELEKPKVREIAEKAGLITARKRDSTGICFIGKRNFGEFISDYLPYQEGEMQTLDGKRVGTHQGVAYYTIGQRKGLGIGGPGDPWFVVKKDAVKNIVYVEQGQNHPALFTSSLKAKHLTWVAGAIPEAPYRCTAKVRYRSPDVPCTIMQINGDRIEVHFETPERAVTAGQAVVFYEGEICLGGAQIT